MVGTDLHLNNTMGCAFVGVLFAVTLYGCSLAQTMFYFREYPKDKLFLKILVTSLWLFDTARTGLDVAFMWYWLVTNHGNPVNLAILPNTFTAEFFLAALTIAVVQIYFIHTIGRLLTGRWYRTPYSLALLAMSLVSFVGGVVSVERINLNTDATVAVIDATVPASIQTITAFITDMIITLSLCAILWGSKTGFKRTETLISTLIVYAIHRGIFTGLVQLAHFATFISTLHQPKLYWMIWHVPGSKIYVNSLLAVLNVRHHISEVGNEIETHISVELEAVSHQSLTYNQTRSRRLSRATASHTRIMLTKEVVRDTEVITDSEQLGVSRKMSPSPW